MYAAWQDRFAVDPRPHACLHAVVHDANQGKKFPVTLGVCVATPTVAVAVGVCGGAKRHRGTEAVNVRASSHSRVVSSQERESVLCKGVEWGRVGSTQRHQADERNRERLSRRDHALGGAAASTQITSFWRRRRPSCRCPFRPCPSPARRTTSCQRCRPPRRRPAAAAAAGCGAWAFVGVCGQGGECVPAAMLKPPPWQRLQQLLPQKQSEASACGCPTKKVCTREQAATAAHPFFWLLP